MRIPIAVDAEQFEKILQAKVSGLSDVNAKRISQRVDTVYIGLDRNKSGTEYQLAASCNFPKIATTTAFSKKNGWECDFLSQSVSKGKKTKYSVYQKQKLMASFPDVNTACIGRDVPFMIEKFHKLLHKEQLESSNLLNRDVYDWLSYEDDIPDEEIRFYATKPQAFLSMLVGAQLNYQLKFVRGSICNDVKNNNQFIMQIHFEFINKRVIPAARGALTLALGLTDAQVKSTNENNLIISNIKLNKKQLYQLLVL